MNVRLFKIEQELKAACEKLAEALDRLAALETQLSEHANAPHGRQRTQSHR